MPPIPDDFASMKPGLTAPGNKHFSVTPNDGVDLAQKPRALWIAGAGNLSMVDEDGTIVVWNSIPASTLLPFRPVRVRATGTTATGIVGVV